MKKILVYLFGIIVFVLSAPDLHASHIVGGEMTYRHISGRKFEIRLSLSRPVFLSMAKAGEFPSRLNSEYGCLNTIVL